MIIDLEQDIQIYDKDTGIHKVSIIDIQNKTVVTIEGLKYNWKDIIFTHRI